jgi:hypothetical protein
MQYDADKDEYICQNQNRLVAIRTETRLSNTKYESEITIYECEDCEGCSLREKGKAFSVRAQALRASARRHAPNHALYRRRPRSLRASVSVLNSKVRGNGATGGLSLAFSKKKASSDKALTTECAARSMTGARARSVRALTEKAFPLWTFFFRIFKLDANAHK